MNLQYTLIEPKDFSHSKTREMMAFKSTGDIIVIILKDIMMKNNFWLKNLVTTYYRGRV